MGADFTLLRCGRFHVEGTLPVGINDAVRARLTRGGVLQLPGNVEVGTWSEFFWLVSDFVPAAARPTAPVFIARLEWSATHKNLPPSVR